MTEYHKYVSGGEFGLAVLQDYNNWTTTLKNIWCASTRAVTFAWQPARLWSKGPGYGAEIFRWGTAVGAEHQSSSLGPAFGDEMSSHTVCVWTNLSQASELQGM